MWEVHMYMMYGTYTAYILFENMCRELLQIDDTNPMFHNLITGFDNKVLQVDKRIWEFSQKAAKMGLADIILGSDPKDIAARIDAAPNGAGFMQEFRAFLDEDGWRMQRMSEMNLPTWIEDPAPPLTNLKQFLVKGDRKSTRLNSSHHSISYAVFCLKKKKK